MKEIHIDNIFHLYDPHQDGKGINLIVYRFNVKAENYYTISYIKHYKTDGSNFPKISIDKNLETIEGLFEIQSKNKTMLDDNPDSPKNQKILHATADIIRHFQEWFYDNKIEFPANYIPNIYRKDFKYLKDYSIVWMKDEKFTLTNRQSQVIQILHEAHKSGTYHLNFTTIIEKVGGEAVKMSDIFKKNKEAMHALVFRNASRRQYSLNIPE